MESLLANYGSDDEEHEMEPPPRTRVPLFASLPPPKEDPAPRSSLFASLPPPKFAGDDTRKPDIKSSNERIRDSSEEKKASETRLFAARRDAGDDCNNREIEESPKFSDDAFSVSGLNSQVSEDTQRKDVGLNADDVIGSSKSRVSLFAALPPPKNTGSSLVPVQSRPLPALPSKRVVQLRPNINMALLKDLDDDEDVQPQAKRHATEVVGSHKATGLAAILPKPKNVGTTLGSGYASGHHATLDVGASINTVASPLPVATNSEFAPQSVQDPSSFSNEHSSETGNSNEHFNERHVIASSEAWDRYNQDMSADLPTHADAVQFNAPSYQSDFVSHESTEVLCPEGYYTVPDDYPQGMLAHETSSSTISSVQDPIDMLLKERRKGGKNAPLNIIEVKQTDLTATKLREDQLRMTGIAFGPAYRPISSNKDKPSKLHRRKHQIGSLYYDMKQKEMELLERRARGHMTKAETQGKYGW